MKYKIFASDEGFGHLVRQQAILDELRRLSPGIEATLQTKRHAHAAKWIFDNVNLIERYNNITWAKTKVGTPDLEKIRSYYYDYLSRSENYIKSETDDINKYNFIISDFVYEAFPIAIRDNLPAFGVAHITWDWFFSKLYPVPVSTEILDRLRNYAMSADRLYFPPFTPLDIINTYKSKVKEVPLIVRKCNPQIKVEENDAFKVQIIDSGAGILSNNFKQALKQAKDMDDFLFFVSESIGVDNDNIIKIGQKELLLDYIPFVDLVIARGGFNVISECIAYRTPLLLLGEALNPEMESNLYNIKQEGLGSFISLQSITNNFKEILYRFIDGEYNIIKQNMENHSLNSNGARIIAEDILNQL